MDFGALLSYVALMNLILNDALDVLSLNRRQQFKINIGGSCPFALCSLMCWSRCIGNNTFFDIISRLFVVIFFQPNQCFVLITDKHCYNNNLTHMTEKFSRSKRRPMLKKTNIRDFRSFFVPIFVWDIEQLPLVVTWRTTIVFRNVLRGRYSLHKTSQCKQ